MPKDDDYFHLQFSSVCKDKTRDLMCRGGKVQHPGILDHRKFVVYLILTESLCKDWDYG